MTRKFLWFFNFLLLAGLAYAAYVWSPSDTTEHVWYSAGSLVVLYAVLVVGVSGFVVRRLADSKTRYTVRKAVSLLFVTVVTLVWLRIWVPEPQALLVAYGVVGAGLAVALQDVVKNLAGGISIFLSGTFQVGNRIRLNGVVGDVIDIGLFHTTLLEVRGWIDADQATGRITTVPNGAVLQQPIYNYTRHHKFLWDELSIVVTSESDWSEAMRLLGEIGEEHTAEFVAAANDSLTNLERYYYVEGHVLEPNVYVKPAADGYSLTLRYVVDAWKRRTTSSNIWGHVLRVFSEHGSIDIAPTTYAITEYPLPK